MSLQSDAISELTTESATFKILNEWLASYFDGQPHAVGATEGIVFPKANRAFGQSAPAQPLHQLGSADVEIRVVLLPRIEIQESNDTVLYSGKLITSLVQFQFWVSAKSPGDGKSEKLAERVGELLKAILTNPATRYDLAVKGITHLQPHAPQWLPSTDYARRMVASGAALQYPMLVDAEGITADNTLIQGDTSQLSVTSN